MPAQTDAREEVLRRAREAARVVLAKHPFVIAGSVKPEAPESVVQLPQAAVIGARNVARELGR